MMMIRLLRAIGICYLNLTTAKAPMDDMLRPKISNCSRARRSFKACHPKQLNYRVRFNKSLSRSTTDIMFSRIRILSSLKTREALKMVKMSLPDIQLLSSKTSLQKHPKTPKTQSKTTI